MVDEVGLGAGVVDRLRELGHSVLGVNVGRPAQDSEHYANLRAKGYWNLRQMFVDARVTTPPRQRAGGTTGGQEVFLQQPGASGDREQGRDAAPRSALPRQGQCPDAGFFAQQPQSEAVGLISGVRYTERSQ